ncbi:MAG: transcription initiation protein [Microbacteriaceae bacterium]|nr:transcription initiation protein [Microbacteriaceae bacterium]
MKYMIAMFGSASEMGTTKTPEWINDMIAFMIDIDVRLRASGEMVYNEGLVDGSQAKVVRLEHGQPVATDGPFAEAKESLIGFWIVDVESEARALEICGEIVVWSDVVELRPVAAGPPEQ